MSKLQEKRSKQQKEKIAAAILMGISAICILFLGYRILSLRQAEKQYEDLRQTESTEAVSLEEETEQGVYTEAIHDFDALRKENEDIYAWITVPNTQVDYPVLQSDTDNYYLDHNLDHSTGYPGCVYTNLCNVKDFSDYITLLYGHNMKNGTMFGSLHKFEEEAFFEENQQIVVYGEESRLTYQIYAATEFSDVYIPAYYDIYTEGGRDKFLDDVRLYAESSKGSYVRDDIELSEDEKIIVLSTCVDNDDEKRYLLVGVLSEEALYR